MRDEVDDDVFLINCVDLFLFQDRVETGNEASKMKRWRLGMRPVR